MKWLLPSRLSVGAALLVLCAVTPAFARGRAQKKVAPPPAVRQNNRPTPQPRFNGPNPGIRGGQNQGHLPQWMESHKNMSLPDMQHALQNEPGFHELPPQTQQRELNQLQRLYNMNPQQRDRTLQRNEVLERMSQPQLQQYRGAVQSFATMAPDRRRLVARAIVDLREMPPDQREQVINSPRFGATYTDGERTTIRTLLTAEPYPPGAPAPPQ